MPPLPHHRAYGSVPRRFGGLSTHQRVHGKQAMILEASVGEGAMQRARRAQPPGSLWAEDGRTGHLVRDPKATEFAITVAARLPLNPDDATQAPSGRRLLSSDRVVAEAQRQVDRAECGHPTGPAVAGRRAR